MPGENIAGIAIMMVANKTSTSVGQTVAVAAAIESSSKPASPNLALGGKASRQSALQPSGALFSPQDSLVWIVGLLAVGACISPWLAHGWLWFGLIATPLGFLSLYDALSLWLTR